MAYAQWAKLKSGAWGVRALATTAKPGNMIEVQKKADGSISSVTVEKVLWTDGKISICAIKRDSKPAPETVKPATYDAGETAPNGAKYVPAWEVWTAPTNAPAVHIDENGKCTPIESAPAVSTFETEVPSKCCWDCGKLFTLNQCQSQRGNWKESYCGC